ncbi:MAG: hypothetical protein GF308_12840 [Candidatus Heimdallarchaeota archaeon]|nr:hypothetical protein [Candidatus Heimdallarchaeota archaeon]
MIQLAIILSSEGEVLLSTSFGELQVENESFSPSFKMIQDAAQKLDEGTALFSNDGYKILVAKEEFPVALVFVEEMKVTQEWKEAAKKISNKFAKILEEGSSTKARAWIVKERAIQQKIKDFKETILEILKDAEHSPIKKMKESLW